MVVCDFVTVLVPLIALPEHYEGLLRVTISCGCVSLVVPCRFRLWSRMLCWCLNGKSIKLW